MPPGKKIKTLLTSSLDEDQDESELSDGQSRDDRRSFKLNTRSSKKKSKVDSSSSDDEEMEDELGSSLPSLRRILRVRRGVKDEPSESSLSSSASLGLQRDVDKEGNHKQRQLIHKIARDSATWDTSSKLSPPKNLNIHSWNARKTEIALERFTLERATPDVLLVQEATDVPSGGQYDRETGITSGTTILKKSVPGYNMKENTPIYFAHADTGSKFLMILSIHPIHNAQLIKTGSDTIGDWRFRPALAAEIGGNKIINMHLVSGNPKLAQRHLSNIIDRSKTDSDVFLAGDANMGKAEFDETIRSKMSLQATSFSANEPTHIRGGALDHAVIYRTTNNNKSLFTRGKSKTMNVRKSSDHSIRQYDMRIQSSLI